MGVTEALRALARQEAEAIAQDISGVRAVVIATGDGFDIASAGRGAVDPQRIAALASSMSAIGAVVSAEAGLGRSTSVTVGTDDGFAVVHAATHRGMDLVINVIAGPDALLGQVNYRTAAAARSLSSA
ncbi:roadblock/LC7 domain-containing protein [Ramlibacter pallidus]|nr:hypothetical protein [Ramlibacter pallidus]